MANGCGPKWLPQWVKDGVGLNCYFKEECDLHDGDYAKGGSEIAKFVYDWRFLLSMKKKANTFKGFDKYARLVVAQCFYWWVRNAGCFSFNYTEE